MIDPRECGAKAVEHANGSEEIALVFGREHSGLTNEELQRCHFHVHIPSNPDFSSLNLAAAVQVLSYEVRMAWLAAEGAPTKVESSTPTRCAATSWRPWTKWSCSTNTWRKPWWTSASSTPKPKHLMPRLRRLYGRSSVNRSEMSILRGILTETQKVARGEPHKRKD